MGIYYNVDTNHFSWYADYNPQSPDANLSLWQLNVESERYSYFAF